VVPLSLAFSPLREARRPDPDLTRRNQIERDVINPESAALAPALAPAREIIGALVLDPDGHNIEACCHTPA
jgi:hypothetical protein